VLRAAVLSLLAVAPLTFGGVTPAARLSLQLAAFALATCAAWIVFLDARPLPAKVGRLAIVIAVPVAVGVVQLLPLPAAVAGIVAPRASELHAGLAEALPAAAADLVRPSIDAGATREALLMLAAVVAVGFAAAVAVRSREHLRSALTVLALAGACQALYGATEYLSGRQQIFGYAKRFHLDSATGSFINRNHFAAYLAILLPAALYVTLDGARRLRPARSWREKLLRLDDPAASRLLAGAVAVMVIWSGVLLSYSRGGLGGAVVGLVVLAVLVAPRRLWWVVPLLALPVALLLAEEIRPPGERLLAGGEELGSLHGRLPAWIATLALARTFLPLGSGLGTFAAAFPLEQPAVVAGSWSHAHNDWLEAALEGGPLTALALAVAVALAALPLARGRDNACHAAVTAALAAAVVACFIDFCARIPGIAITMAGLVGMSCCHEVVADGSPPRETAVLEAGLAPSR
jgi:hypothetical protein